MRLNACRALALVALWPSLVFGQEKTGVVTALEGHVTAARVAQPQPVLLKFKDEVYRNDRITTGDRSLARMLLGGKAVVTVRERSVITITEAPGRSTIDLVSGKIGLAVAKERMRPGESIEVRSPNAVCAVRGTVIVAEVQNTTAPGGSGGSGVLTTFYVLRGAVDAFQVVPGTNTQAGALLRVNTMQSFTAAGNAPSSVDAITPERVAQITEGLTPSGLQQGQTTTDQVLEDQLSIATWPADPAIDRGCCQRPRPSETSVGTPTTTPEETTVVSSPPPTAPPPPSTTPPGVPPSDGGGLPGVGKLKGLDRADQVAGDQGRQGRQNARDKQAR